MKSRIIKRNDGTNVIYHRYPEGNDIVSTDEYINLFMGNIGLGTEDNCDFIVDGNSYYYKYDDGVKDNYNYFLNPKEEKTATRTSSNQFIDWDYNMSLKDCNTTLFTISCWAKKEPGSTVTDIDFYFRDVNGGTMNSLFHWFLTDEYRYYTETIVLDNNKNIRNVVLCRFRAQEGEGKFYIKDVSLKRDVARPFWQKVYLGDGNHE